jgi:endonuclease I
MNYGVNGWNREHLWPNSYGFDIDVTTTWPALRDLFNLRPCDSQVNSSRGNKYYDFSDATDINWSCRDNGGTTINQQNGKSRYGG